MTTLSPRDVLALTLLGEARGEPIEGKIAVACVIRNRLEFGAGRYGDSLERVCLKPKQFSCWNSSDPNLRVLQAFAAAMAKGEAIVDPIYRECEWVADGLLKGVIQPRVGKATHYYSVTLGKPPKWAEGAQWVARVGRHLFFQDVDK